MKTLPRFPVRPAFLLLAIGLFAWVLACTPPKPPATQDNLVVGKLDGGTTVEPASAAPPAQSEDDASVPIFANDATRGSRLAAVTIVVFSDFQCPFCSRLVPVLDRLYEEYGGDNVRIVFKNQPLPFHQHAQPAAEVGQGVLELAGNEAFWRFHNMVFAKQQRLSDPDMLLGLAVAAGADEQGIREGMRAKRWETKVNRDREVARSKGASGTPTSFIDGILLSGAQPYEKFQALVDSELKESRALAEKGIPRDQIYTRLAALNFKAKGDDDDDDRDSAREAAELKVVHKIPVAATSPVRGPATAEVTIVEFSDFQCPYCKRAETTLDRVRREYGDKVRIVWRDLPLAFHPRAEPAAQLARAARAQKGDAAFWQVHDALFAAQPKLEDADLEQIAQDAKLDVQKAMAAVKAKTYAPAIEIDQNLADDFDVSGTPNFFINGRHMVGAQPFDKFKVVIDEEIAKATLLLNNKSATKATLYDALIKDGKGPPEPERRAIPGLAANAPFKGSANAKVVIQQFSDFQCPFCARVEPTIDELLKAMPGKVKVVWRDHPLPFHPDAPLAAEAGREAFKQKGNDGFWKMHALMFKSQQSLKRDDLDRFAGQLGLDMAKWNAALDNHTHASAVAAENKVGEDGKVSGTPGFLIGPYYLSGAQPLVKFKKLVNLAMNPPPAPATQPASPTPTPTPTVTPPAPAPAPSNLIIRDISTGSGDAVKAGDEVKVHYVGTLTDGSEFDASRKHGNDGFTFKVGQGRVIKGWDQGLVGMKVGGKRKLTIPPDLAYGDRGAGGKIPGGATLIFEIDLLEIKRP